MLPTASFVVLLPVVERNATRANRVRVCFAAEPDSIAGRQFHAFEFLSSMDRERFIHIINHAAIVPARFACLHNSVRGQFMHVCVLSASPSLRHEAVSA